MFVHHLVQQRDDQHVTLIMILNIQDSFNKELPADAIRDKTRRQVKDACFSYVTPRVPSKPQLIHASVDFAASLGLTPQDLESDTFKQLVSGATVLPGTDPYAMCYGGHQFGHWAGQLGDGRAINLAELVHDDQRWALQLKGAGETTYSRTADGLAVLRSSIREHLCSEAMYYLGVPTTRSLALSLTGDQVLRDVMYDGNSAYEKGAVVCRVAPSFIRFGNFEILASHGDIPLLKQLADYTIRHFYPEIKGTGKDSYIAFFNAVADKTLAMIIDWQRVGFVHGVMNTDNMSILGQTIDYGPYGWLEGYDPNWTPNTTDKHQRRYRYGNQPAIGLWNLSMLASALFPLVEDRKVFEDALELYKSNFQVQYKKMMMSKLGLEKELDKDDELIHSLSELLVVSETDMTIFFRQLSRIRKSNSSEQVMDIINQAFYKPEEIKDNIAKQWQVWINQYLQRINNNIRPDEERADQMNGVNPKYVLRNYMAQLAIDAADGGDYGLISDLYELLKRPYAEQVTNEKWNAKRPDWARHKIGCSMLSCSS